MKKRILLTGCTNNLINDFLSHQTDTYEFKLATASTDMLQNTLRKLRPHAIIISLQDIIREDIYVFQIFKDSPAYKDLPILTIGNTEDCETFDEVIPTDTTSSLHSPFSIKDFAKLLDKLTAYTDEPDYTDPPLLNEPDTSIVIPAFPTNTTSTMTNTPVSAIMPAIASATSTPSTPHITTRPKAPTYFGKKRILVVDDDPRMLRSIKIQLEGVFDVTVVKNGRNALQYLSSHIVDLILLDYVMPDEDGTIVLQAIRQVPDFANIPVIFLTGVSDGDKVKKGLELNPQGYLLKPVSRDILIRTIETTLKKILDN